MSPASRVDLPAAPMAGAAGAPLLRRLTAPNPGPMTGDGTNSFLLGSESLAIIDPGPAIDAHLDALTEAAAGRPVFAVLVTHSHLDHSGGARRLAERLGAPLLGFGPHEAGRSAAMQALAAQPGGMDGGEGADRDFAPDRLLADGDALTAPDGAWRLTALHTPGHTSNHLSFALETPEHDGAWRSRALFCGDHVMAWSTSLVSPPDGDMGAFMSSLARLSERDDPLYLPAHGDAVADPKARLAELTKHRRGREAAVLAALEHGPANAEALARRIYTDVAPRLLPLATRNVLAHLIDLWERKRLTLEGEIVSAAAIFRLS